MIQGAKDGKLKKLLTSAEECLALCVSVKICFPGSGMVETPEGAKPMSSLVLGDHVATYRKGEGVIYTEVKPPSLIGDPSSSLVGWTGPPPSHPPTSASSPPPPPGSPSPATTPCSGCPPPPGPWRPCTPRRWRWGTGFCRGPERGWRRSVW